MGSKLAPPVIECVSPLYPGGGNTRLRVRGRGANSDDWRKKAGTHRKRVIEKENKDHNNNKDANKTRDAKFSRDTSNRMGTRKC